MQKIQVSDSDWDQSAHQVGAAPAGGLLIAAAGLLLLLAQSSIGRQTRTLRRCGPSQPLSPRPASVPMTRTAYSSLVHSGSDSQAQSVSDKWLIIQVGCSETGGQQLS